jgi:hypothetical protein
MFQYSSARFHLHASESFLSSLQSGFFNNLQELKMLVAGKQAKTVRGLDQGVHWQHEAFFIDLSSFNRRLRNRGR